MAKKIVSADVMFDGTSWVIECADVSLTDEHVMFLDNEGVVVAAFPAGSTGFIIYREDVT